MDNNNEIKDILQPIDPALEEELDKALEEEDID